MTLAPWMQQSAGVMDPRNSAWFGTGNPYGEGPDSLGNADGDVHSSLPDEVFDYIPQGEGDPIRRINQDRLQQWLGSNQIMQAFRPGSSARWIQGPNGEVLSPVEETSTDDSRFMTAAALAAAVTGANVMGAAGGAGAATTGPQPLNMAMIESGLGTPGYGFNAGAAAATNPAGGLLFPNTAAIGSGAGSMFGAGGEVVANPAYGPLKTMGTIPPSGVEPVAPIPTSGGPVAMPVIPPAATVPSFGGGGLLNTIGDAATKVGGYLADNPKLIGAIGGAVLPLLDGGSDGGEAPYSGPMPTITRGDWKPRQQANYMQVPQFGQGFLSNQQPTNNNAGLWRYGAQSGLLGGAPAMPTGLLAPGQQPSTTGSNTSYTPQEIRDYASAQGWFTNDGLMVPGSERKIYDAAQQFGVGGNQLDQAFNWGSGTADNYVSGQNWAALSGQR